MNTKDLNEIEDEARMDTFVVPEKVALSPMAMVNFPTDPADDENVCISCQ